MKIHLLDTFLEQIHSLLPIEYGIEFSGSVIEEILKRAKESPINIVSTLIFLCAVTHILFSKKILDLSHRIERKNGKKSFWSEVIHFLGEVEIVFGIWAIPLVLAITLFYNWQTALDYLNTRNYEETIAVVVIMTIATSYPIVHFVNNLIEKIANLGNGTPGAWWLTLLTIGPVMGAFITEAGAMILTCMLLLKNVFTYKISKTLSYATLGLLFTNISLAGIITVFASAPALVVAGKWQWNSAYMFSTFGWKSITAMLIANFCYYWLFRKEFNELSKMEAPPKKEKEVAIPVWITFGNFAFLLFTIIFLEEPVVCIACFLFFLGFHQATRPFQEEVVLRPALLVGFFIAGLVIHASMQSWWIAPLLAEASSATMLAISIGLGPFADNATLTYLASMIPNISEASKYNVMIGAVAAGGLTVIGNAPNPAGQQLLASCFPGGISPRNLFLGALTPMLIALLVFMFL